MDNITNGATAIDATNGSGLDYVKLQNHQCLTDIDIINRRKVFSYALAVVIARSLPVPTTPVESPASYYIGNAENNVRYIASAFNEKIVIDYELVRDVTKMLWNIRYFSLHSSNNIGSFFPYSFFEIISGAGNVIDQATYAFANEYKVAIIDLSNIIARILVTDKKEQ